MAGVTAELAEAIGGGSRKAMENGESGFGAGLGSAQGHESGCGLGEREGFEGSSVRLAGKRHCKTQGQPIQNPLALASKQSQGFSSFHPLPRLPGIASAAHTRLWARS